MRGRRQARMRAQGRVSVRACGCAWASACVGASGRAGACVGVCAWVQGRACVTGGAGRGSAGGRPICLFFATRVYLVDRPAGQVHSSTHAATVQRCSEAVRGNPVDRLAIAGIQCFPDVDDLVPLTQTTGAFCHHARHLGYRQAASIRKATRALILRVRA